ncbi:YfhO family protein, partial [bacterium]|nr:YfhO family protein [candidate division CSSED10-310 bacterium]
MMKETGRERGRPPEESVLCSYRPWIAAQLVLIALILLFYHPLLTGDLAAGYDITQAFYHYREFVRGSLQQGVIPLWNPHIFCGYPCHAALQSSVLHPLTFLLAPLPTECTITLSLLLYLCLGAGGMLLFMRELRAGVMAGLFAAVTFTFSTFFMRHLLAGHLTHLCTMLGAPFLFYLYTRYQRRPTTMVALLSGIYLTTLLLLGHPQFLFFSFMGLILYQAATAGLHPRTGFLRALFQAIRFDAVSGAVCLLLGAAQLLPSLEFMSAINRSGQADFNFVTDSSMPFENLLTFFVPAIFGDGLTVPYWGRWYLWEVTDYLGSVALLLALMALVRRRGDRQRLVLGFTAMAALILCFGRYTPAYGILLHIVPGIGLFRNPGRFLFIVNIALSAMAGLGLEDAVRRPLRRAWFWIGMILALAAVVLSDAAPAPPNWWKCGVDHLTAAAGALTSVPRPSARELYDTSFHLAAMSLTMSLSILAAVLVILALRWSRRVKTVLLTMLVALDLHAAGARYVGTTPVHSILWPQSIMTQLRKTPGRYRLLPLIRQADLNVPMSLGINSPGGYDSTCPSRFNDLVLLMNGEPPGTILTSVQIYRFTPLLDLLGLRFLLLPDTISPGRLPYAPLLTEDGLTLYEKRTAVGRAYLAWRPRLVKNRDEALRMVGSADFDPGFDAVVEHNLGTFPDGLEWEETAPRRPITPVEFTVDEAHRLRMEVECDSPCLLVIADSYDDGWLARVDGRRREILPANGGFRGIPLTAGTHDVLLQYQPPGYVLGLWLSMVTMLGLAAAGGRWWRHRHSMRQEIPDLDHQSPANAEPQTAP